ncbi:MAG: ketoacyl-ACP synthase III [Myxococcales bacterium]|nr:MAG: ketoacyl-ACP synthase III [Myxococcales bacterium]
MPGTTIIGTGHFVPGEPVHNDALARVMDTNDDWIHQRTGIRQRYYAEDGTGSSDLGKEAAVRALKAAKVSPEEVDYILCATMTPEFVYPGSGGLLGAKLGIPGVPALDIRMQCAAIPFALQVADGLINTGAANTVLLVGAEVQSGFMPWNDWDTVRGRAQNKIPQEDWDKATRQRGVSVLFGDGAGAFVLRKSEIEGHGLIGSALYTDGRDVKLIYVQGGGFTKHPYVSKETLENDDLYPRMQGRDLFKSAAVRLPKAVREVCLRCNINIDDIDYFVAHQANDRINEAVRHSLKVPTEKIPSNIAKYGNTSAATIPILLDELILEGRVKKGDLLCFLALGAGLHWGASLLRL